MKTIEVEIGRARLGMAGKKGFEPGAIGWVTFDHYATRPTVEIIRPDEDGLPVTEPPRDFRRLQLSSRMEL